jgi:hypothetical protein
VYAKKEQYKKDMFHLFHGNIMKDGNDIHLWTKHVTTRLRDAWDGVYNTAAERDDDVTSIWDVLQVSEDVGCILSADWLLFAGASVSC